MQIKSLAIESMDEAGKGLARLGSLSAVDHDGDTYLPGAFNWKSGGQWCPLITAHNRGSMPFGKARVYEDGDTIYAELMLNLDTTIGREWHAALRFDLAQGKAVQEWSYGYDALDADYQIRPEGRVRVLKRLDVHEVSTVVRGAGQGTGTVAIKSATLKPEHFGTLIAGLSDLANVDPFSLSATGIKQLEDLEVSIGRVLEPHRQKARAEQQAEHMILGVQLERMSKAHLPVQTK